MKRLSFAMASLLLSVSAFGCLHKGGSRGSDAMTVGVGDSGVDVTSDSGSKPLSASPVAEVVKPDEVTADGAKLDEVKPALECKERACIMSYLPVSCYYKDQFVESNNDCTGKVSIVHAACKEGVKVNDKEVVCVIKDDAKAKEQECKDINKELICNRDSKPTSCVIEGKNSIEAKGENVCLAQHELAKKLCIVAPIAGNDQTAQKKLFDESHAKSKSAKCESTTRG
ncbi:MAG: hypothetical protein V4655_13730 [Bdellovibrionota bacterium]